MIRKLDRSDIPDLVKIVYHQDVLAQSLRGTAAHFKERALKVSQGHPVDNKLGALEIYVADICGSVCGYISFTEYVSGKYKCGYVGWDFSPKVWGKGIASTALREFIEIVVKPRRIEYLLSCCYSDNLRCIKFIAKLGFERVGVPWYRQLMFMASNFCFRQASAFQLPIVFSAQQADAPDPGSDANRA